MRGASWATLGVALAVALPWACDDSPSAEDPGAAGTGAGLAGPGGGGPGGGGTVCGDDCTVQCDAPPTEGSGECVGVGGPFECNPVTNDQCTGGRVCDFGPGGFRCYGGDDNTGKLCDSCGPSSHCGPGLTCSTFGVCTKFCCGDADCGSNGKCEISAPLLVGTCIKGAGGPGPTSSAESSGSPASSSMSSSGNGGAGNQGGGGASSSSSSASAGGAGGDGGG